MLVSNVKKSMLLSVLIFVGLNAQSGEFDKGSTEFDPPGYSEAEIQQKIQNEMAIACSGNLCKIVGQDNQGSGWTVTFQIGYGNNTNTGNGDIIYVGGTNNTNNGAFANITVSYKNFKCRSNLLVTPAVYRFVNTYLYNMVNADGSVKRNFSPADQTVILFYTTMLNKVDSCSNGMK